MANGRKINPAFGMDEDDDGGDNHEHPVTRQPARQEFRIYQYENESRQRIINLSHTHKRPKRLKTAVNETTEFVTRATEERRQTLRSGMTYDQFMAGLLYEDEEKLLNGRFLYYDKIEFVYECTKVNNEKKPMKQGRAFLTNHRLLLLSSEEVQVSLFTGVERDEPAKKTKKELQKEKEKEPTLVAVTNDLSTADLTGLYTDMRERKPYVINPRLPKAKYYGIFGYARDIVNYFSIPLECIKSVEFDADIGAVAMTIIKGKKPCFCKGLCGCCGGDSCTKAWNPDWNGTGEANHRVVSLGVSLPPWGHDCYVHIYINADQRIDIVRDLIVDLQHYAPELHTKKVDYQA